MAISSPDIDALFREYRETRDPIARETLVERFLPLARRLARRYERGDESFDDLLQVASLGLVKAVDRYEPDRGVAFSSYAVPTILGELKRYFRDTGWAVHVPRGLQERAMKADQTAAKLTTRLGRAPSIAEVAEGMRLTIEEVLEAMGAAQAYDAVSLEAGRDTERPEEGTIGETLGEEDERLELVEYGQTIAGTLKALPDRDRLVLRLRFVDDLTQSEIAARIGVSQMQVSRLIRRALDRLRTVAEST
ncbi:MAG TPA: SigB/SigF/SigG family RNA polymerase sigma factor [Solirubrobacteraceae bacterium]|nr:SigB/SigF/SigG family RNA polymerase sigma factor [Solirubrobacteraceae bacterium]